MTVFANPNVGLMSGAASKGTGQVVAFKPSSTGAMSSPNGSTSWADTTLANSPGSINVSSKMCAWSGTKWVAITSSGAIQSSTDGISWSDVGTSISGWVALNSIIWAGTQFVIIGNGNAAQCAATSPDGITWTGRNLPSNANWQDVAWNGTTLCAVARTGNTKAATSTDGITWTAQTLPASGAWINIAWNGTVFAAVGNASIAGTSPDGATWTNRTGSWSFPSGIAWNGSVFCVVDNGTRPVTSPDGATWTNRTFNAGTSWQGICWNGTNFIVMSASGTTSQASADGTTWSNITVSSSGTWSCCCANWLQFTTY